MADTYSITYRARGTTYTLNGADATTGLTFNYLGDQGFGLAPLHRITTRGPLQDGDSDIDFRLDPRILQIPLVVKNASTSPMYQSYAIREALLSIFRPADSGVIAVTVSDGTSTISRSINVEVLGGLSFDVEPTSYHVRTVVQLRAEDPTWYNPTSITLTFPYTKINDFSPAVFSVTGNSKAYPIIRINGPITNPIISNISTFEVITITATISAGAYFDIDLSYGAKTVVDDTGTNRISTVSATSDLATWHFQPGVNYIRVTGTSTSSTSDIDFTYFARYTGI